MAGVSFESLSREEAAEAAHLLTTWYHLSTTRRIDDLTDLNELLLLFGFQVRKLKKLEAGRGWAEMSVETDAIRDRSICPLPQFGSEAKGRYRLLLNWVQPVSESIARIIGGGGERADNHRTLRPGSDRTGKSCGGWRSRSSGRSWLLTSHWCGICLLGAPSGWRRYSAARCLSRR